MSDFLEQLRARAAALNRRIVFPEGTEERTIQAVARLQQERLLQPILLGPPDKVRHALDEAGGEGAGATVLDPVKDPRRDRFAAELLELRKARGLTKAEAAERVTDPLFFGAMLVRTGEADGSVAGALRTTADVLRAAIWCVGPAPGIQTVSSAFYMVVRPFRGSARPEVLTFTDAGVVPEPGARQLADIAQAAAQARRRIVGDEPRVAFLSYSTKGSAAGASVARIRDALTLFRERAPDVQADGELQADAALVPQVAAKKLKGESPVAGKANVLVFPDLDAGNIGYKLTQCLAGARAIGPVLQGFARPLSDLSRGASVEDIVATAAIVLARA
ncbi:MAG: phosphate acetyltransferase [Gemmatimonadetes bacterium]|nr:phosphate acetyltransferase [Gemmatimonadota bacterium]